MAAHSRQLLAHLINLGYVTESGLSRAARIRRCRRCHADTLAGLDDVTCALEVHCDPDPLTPLGELMAVLEGRRTYAVHREGGRFVLDPRLATEIRGAPAGDDKREDVVRAHVCGTAPPTATAGTNFVEAKPQPAHTTPPF